MALPLFFPPADIREKEGKKSLAKIQPALKKKGRNTAALERLVSSNMVLSFKTGGDGDGDRGERPWDGWRAGREGRGDEIISGGRTTVRDCQPCNAPSFTFHYLGTLPYLPGTIGTLAQVYLTSVSVSPCRVLGPSDCLLPSPTATSIFPPKSKSKAGGGLLLMLLPT